MRLPDPTEAEETTVVCEAQEHENNFLLVMHFQILSGSFELAVEFVHVFVHVLPNCEVFYDQ